jgi:NAD(P)-dependent dehydrogenase (short-subunit alcohol dehydrogenase family)
MAQRGFGRVLFASSVAAFTGGLVGPHYTASKAGLHGLLYWLASAYAMRGVTVSAIAPAPIADTDMLPGGRQAAVPGPCAAALSSRPMSPSPGRADRVAAFAPAWT